MIFSSFEFKIMEEPIKIKQEKVTPERETKKNDIEKLLETDLFGEKNETEEKKEIEPTK